MLRIYTVTEITRRIRDIVASDESLACVWVKGEVIDFRHHSSGHMYFTLKDAEARLRCVMFRSQNLRLAFKPADGTQVLAFGSVGVFERYGEYQLYVEQLEPVGLGSLHLALEQMKAKLAAEGLFDQARKRPIPWLPSVVGIVTSPTGAAVQDIIRIVTSRMPLVDVIVVPALVQGPGAAQSIADAIARANRLGGIDVLIVGRGGGAMEELWAFNEEVVVRAIRSSAIPVISAVGHETDFVLSDFAADIRAPTPSAAAEIAVPKLEDVAARLQTARLRAARALRQKVRLARQQVMTLQSTRWFRSPMSLVDYRAQELDGLAARLSACAGVFARVKRQAVLALGSRLRSLDPRSVLARGYALCRTVPEGRVVSSVAAVAPGDRVSVTVADGSILCRVEGATREGVGVA